LFKDYYYNLLSKYLKFYTKGYGGVISKGSPLNENLTRELDIATHDKQWKFVVAEGAVQKEKCILTFLKNIHTECQAENRLILTYYSNLWKIPLLIASFLGLRERSVVENWVTHSDIENLLLLSDFEKIHFDSRVICPFYIPWLSNFLNRYIAPLPLFRHLCLVNILIARPLGNKEELNSVSIVVAARNEAGNLETMINRIPDMSGSDEIIIVEGGSSDNTWEVSQDLMEKYPNRNILVAQQEGKGKGDAVRKGFEMASKDILMILDADMTVPPEDLVMFYDAIKSQKGEYINGSRLVYKMEDEAMRYINMMGNKFFAFAFSFVLGQNLRDTLCGTKVISKKNYEVLSENRSFFGDFDPFGDFDLIFGASRMSLKIVEVPISYKERTYGETNISRWVHGALLMRMLWFATKRIKFI
jgi:hypothetical protein